MIECADSALPVDQVKIAALMFHMTYFTPAVSRLRMKAIPVADLLL
jgi:hypothetical protein